MSDSEEDIYSNIFRPEIKNENSVNHKRSKSVRFKNNTKQDDLNDNKKKNEKGSKIRMSRSIVPKNENNRNNDNQNLRPILIDGSNVAREHGKSYGGAFSCKGIKLAVDFFLNLGHKHVEAFVPRFRRGKSDKLHPTINGEILDELEKVGNLKYCPDKTYDDRFIIAAALHHNGVIISNDKYRDILEENPEYKNRIIKIEYVFSGDFFMVPPDPFGRNGPSLEYVLKFTQNPGVKIPNIIEKKIIPSVKKTPTTKPNDQKHTDEEIKTERTKNETLMIFNKLKSIFDIDTNVLNEILRNNPYEKKINFFTKILSTIPKSNKDKNRTDLETKSLMNIMCILFPNKEKEIQNLLNEYPTKSKDDLDFLINKFNNVDKLKHSDKNAKTRSKPETEYLLNILNELFPNKNKEIENLLNEYPTENQNDLDFFIDLLNLPDSNGKGYNKINIASNSSIINNQYKNEFNKNNGLIKEDNLKLKNDLLTIFPYEQEQINNLLKKYPNKTQLDFFINLMVKPQAYEKLEMATNASSLLNQDDNYSNKQNINHDKTIKREFMRMRSKDETDDIFKKLLIIFPNNEKEIKETLEAYRTRLDLDYLTDKLLQRIY